MSLFQFLQLQSVEPEDTDSSLDTFNRDEITLDDTIDGDALDQSWGAILHSDDTEK